MTTQAQVRNAFYEFCKELNIKVYKSKRQNDQPCDTRCAFVDFVNNLAKSGEISEQLAQKVTL